MMGVSDSNIQIRFVDVVVFLILCSGKSAYFSSGQISLKGKILHPILKWVNNKKLKWTILK